MRVADPQPKAADLAGRDVDVILARHQAVAGALKPKPLVDDVENPGWRRRGRASSLCRTRNAIDELFLAGWGPASISRSRPMVSSSLTFISLSSAMSSSRLSALLVFVHNRPMGVRPAGRRRGRRVAGTLVGTVDRHEGRAHLGKVPCKLFARKSFRSGCTVGVTGRNTRPGEWRQISESRPLALRTVHTAPARTVSGCRCDPPGPATTRTTALSGAGAEGRSVRRPHSAPVPHTHETRLLHEPREAEIHLSPTGTEDDVAGNRQTLEEQARAALIMALHGLQDRYGLRAARSRDEPGASRWTCRWRASYESPDVSNQTTSG